MDITGIGAVADFASNLVNRFFPDKSEQERAQISLMLATINGQMQANANEANNPNLFVSGWRPFIGWCCGAACVWNWMGLPVAEFFCEVFGKHIQMRPADLSEMLPILIGMLGLGAYRTYEKTMGVARK